MAVAIGPVSRRAEALADLRDDFDELRFLCDAAPAPSPRLDLLKSGAVEAASERPRTRPLRGADS
ncbi:MAG: hypothetical protein ABI948_00410 [Thermoleophilia bacterium]